MTKLYFDESIQDRGDFIIGALVLSDEDLSRRVREVWLSMGLDPAIDEFKSRYIKIDNPLGQTQREELKSLLSLSSLAFTVCPLTDRRQLGSYMAALVFQLLDVGFLIGHDHELL